MLPLAVAAADFSAARASVHAVQLSLLRSSAAVHFPRLAATLQVYARARVSGLQAPGRHADLAEASRPAAEFRWVPRLAPVRRSARGADLSGGPPLRPVASEGHHLSSSPRRATPRRTTVSRWTEPPLALEGKADASDTEPHAFTHRRRTKTPREAAAASNRTASLAASLSPIQQSNSKPVTIARRQLSTRRRHARRARWTCWSNGGTDDARPATDRGNRSDGMILLLLDPRFKTACERQPGRARISDARAAGPSSGLTLARADPNSTPWTHSLSGSRALFFSLIQIRSLPAMFTSIAARATKPIAMARRMHAMAGAASVQAVTSTRSNSRRIIAAPMPSSAIVSSLPQCARSSLPAAASVRFTSHSSKASAHAPMVFVCGGNGARQFDAAAAVCAKRERALCVG